jgi:hypothetical protein
VSEADAPLHLEEAAEPGVLTGHVLVGLGLPAQPEVLRAEVPVLVAQGGEVADVLHDRLKGLEE